MPQIAHQTEIGDSKEAREKVKALLNPPLLNIRQIAKRIGKNERAARRIIWRMEQLGEVKTEKIGATNYYKI